MTGILWAITGAALAYGLAQIGSSIGIGYAGQAANGLLSEQPEKFGPLVILVALPGTQGIYGFLAAFLVMMKIGLLGGELASVSTIQGLQILAACLPIALGGWWSGIHQGKVCAAGVAVAAKKPGDTMKAVIYAALVETYAVLGLVVTIFLLNGIKL
jgi:V/A-type H+-transporting ATPase subunit K